MMKNRTKVFQKILTAAILITAVMFLTSSKSHATDENPAMQRPGAKNEEGVVNVTSPDAYPDLSLCINRLHDPNIYRGSKRRILKQIEPGKDGWLFRSADFRTDFSMSEQTFNYMVSVNEALKAKGVDLYLVIQPARAMLMHEYINPHNMPEGYSAKTAKKNYKELIKKLNSAGVKAVDLSDTPSDLVYFFKGDPHWRREGAQWTAEQLAKMIRKNKQYKKIKKEEFSVEITWWLESEKGEFDEFVEEICEVEIPPERRPMWATTSLSGVSEDSLFGDVTYPDIAIIGTSNTAHEEDFNFVGSLKQALNADIRNKALSAGAFSGSGLLFFSTEEFHQYPPKILIWEFLSHHNFEDPVGFRQMLPAIQGQCTDDNALAMSDNVTINIPVIEEKPTDPESEPNTTTPQPRKPVEMHEVVFMDYLEDKNIRALDSYLQLDVTNPENRLLKVSVLYANGDADTIDVTRSRRGENNGRYYIDFSQDFDQELMLIQIETDKPTGTVKARLCKKNKNT